MHFLGLIFKLNCLSLSNTSSSQSNISVIVKAKMQVSLRYNNRVTNCWSYKHCSIKQQKLETTFESLNSIWVNLYKPIEPALNAAFFMLLSSITNCRNPHTRSNEENHLLQWTAYRASSILCSGKASLIMIKLCFQYSMHRWISPFFFSTITIRDAWLGDGLIMPCLNQVSKHLSTSPCKSGGMVWCGK